MGHHLAALYATAIDPTAHSIIDRTFDCLPKGIVTENAYQLLTHIRTKKREENLRILRERFKNDDQVLGTVFFGSGFKYKDLNLTKDGIKYSTSLTPWQETVTGVRPEPRVVVTRQAVTYNLDGVEPTSKTPATHRSGWSVTTLKDLYRFFLTDFLATSPERLREELTAANQKHDEIIYMVTEPSGRVDLSLLDSIGVAPTTPIFEP
ncbi:hypothetical protein N7488_006464 [Penicillium malachiteum]|nr:hypothetical protein N7488_006464 [Penicillium malachiteum]